MAIIYGDIKRLLIKYPEIDLKEIKFIGWGAGQWFKDYYSLLNIDVSYTVCPREENVGKIINGIEVKSTASLRSEDPEKVCILIFASHHNEIMNQIRAIGDFKCMRTIAFGMDGNTLAKELLSLQENINHIPICRGKKTSSIGFFYQGPVFPYTELALAYQRKKYPDDYHCLVTNRNNPADALRKCARWVDEIIEIDEADRQGYFVRNNMIRTAKTGARHLLENGCDYSVRVRSGNVVVGDVSDYITHNFGEEGNLNLGKIGFFMGWSWKNVPFHLSDAFMLARASDMANLWALDEDLRNPADPEFQLTQQTHFSELRRISNENYLWESYAQRAGFPVETMKDYLDFMVKKILPLEPRLTTHSLKHLPIFNMDHDTKISPDIQWWDSLNKNFDLELQRGQARLDMNFTVEDHWSARVG